jgi:hypothetical protein
MEGIAIQTDKYDHKEPGAIVPIISHSTLENILTINKALFKILIEYQNNNWLNEPDFIIYQV